MNWKAQRTADILQARKARAMAAAREWRAIVPTTRDEPRATWMRRLKDLTKRHRIDREELEEACCDLADELGEIELADSWVRSEVL